MASDPIVVVGAGITGLAAARALVAGGADVIVLEASWRSGGNVRTTIRDGCVLDEGPDGWVGAKPAATELALRIGLDDRVVDMGAGGRTTYLASERGLVGLPDGMMLGIPTRLWPMARSPLLSMRGKLRAALDLVEPAGFGRGHEVDESIGAFVARRLGSEVRDRIAQPLLGGIFQGDVDRLSLAATFPQLAAFETRGGLIRGSREVARRGVGKSPMLSLRGGLGEMIHALDTALGSRVLHDVSVADVRRAGDGFLVTSSHGVVAARSVLITAPAPATARMLERLDVDLAHELASVRQASATTVFLAFPRRSIEECARGSGYLVPARLGRPAAAVTWITNKWPDRAPSGVIVARVFLRSCSLPDDDAVALALDELRSAFGILSLPTFTHVARFPDATPVPEVGHLARLGRIRRRVAESPGLHLAGNGFDGFGISDCVRQGEVVARVLLKRRAA